MLWRKAAIAALVCLAVVGICSAQSNQTSCVAAGFTSCCLANDCDLESGCFCDQTCYFAGDCCSDIELVCPPDPCIINPCQNGGGCVPSNSTEGFTCQCSFGFMGDLCDVDIDFCLSSPCFNGNCTDGIFSFSCSCPDGFEGRQCETNVDDCAIDPCVNGTCADGVNDYTCSCDRGFDGRNCEINVDDCFPGACQNGGSCVDGIEAFSCVCPMEFGGLFCESLSTCSLEENNCLNNGICIISADEFGNRTVSCNCSVGYTGELCEVETDECSTLPCQNGGTCLDGVGTFVCLCPEGYSGEQCEIDIDICETNPCQNEALCVEDSGGFMCFCRNGFTGTLCQVNINDCVDIVCQNGGICTDGIADFTCNCMEGFAGELCQFSTSHPCANTPCENGGMCTATSDTNYSCICLPDFTGVNCSVELSPCFFQPCLNSATCINRGAEYECICQPGYTGQDCETNANECLSNPCQNAATCTDLVNGFMCECADGFEGDNCEVDIDECATNPCQNNATCMNLVADYSCLCPDGFTGTECETNIDECDQNPCQNGATCMDGVNSFTCLCSLGYTGLVCDVDIPDCAGEPCANNGTCEELLGGYNCICTPGFTGLNCVIDIDDCSSNPCLNNATCRDGIDSFTCECAPGYTGALCEQPIGFCTPSPCLNNATCVSALDGPICTCLPIFTGSFCEIQLECSLACSNGSTCVADSVTGFECVCPIGFTGNLCEIPIDNCIPAPCQNNGTCFNTPAGFVCQCAPGFTGPNCNVNINECEIGPCMNNGICIDLENAFECLCPDGFTGTICQTNIDDCSPNPCLNNGTCVDLVAEYQCECIAGYAGTECDIDIDLCDPSPCVNGGNCTQNLTAGTVECICPPGYQGSTCLVDVNECDSSPCANGATCRNTMGSFMCQCPPGFDGPLCEMDGTDDCEFSVCLNGATCIDIGTDFRCQCPPGFTGILCDMPTDECAEDPCMNGGQCIDGFLSFTCECPTDFSGLLCEFNLNPCSSDPCNNDAECINGPPGLEEFQCSCLPGFTGTLCETNIDECSPTNPCLNGATCEDDINNVTCICTPGFGGHLCEINIHDDCAIDICLNGGDCVDIGADFMCICAAGFTGTICEFGANECQDNPCLNGGSCRDLLAGFQCFCEEGYTGEACEIDIDECVGMNCNNGSCIDGVNSFSCACTPGYTGDLCEVEIDECVGVVCENGGTCRDLVNNFTCNCITGFLGRFCEVNIDECIGVNCNNGSCVDLVNGFECECDMGWTGAFCDVMINDCVGDPCMNGATCIDLLNNYTCICADGFEGRFCEIDINECDGVTCMNGGLCVDLVNDFQCNCTIGFTGLLCEIDIDECVGVNCNNGSCIDGVNTFSCDCTPGYTGDLCEVEIDECVGVVCENGGTCRDLGNNFTCNCITGFSGRFCEVNIDECIGVNCNNGSCVDLVNGFECECNPGFNGPFCTELINECADVPCLNNATCTDRTNNFTCECIEGFEGRFCEINIDNCTDTICQNGATCFDLVNDFECLCISGYTGQFCDTIINLCESTPCHNNATCTPAFNAFSCECSPRYTGQLCETEIDLCIMDQPCENDGICTSTVINGIPSFQCMCIGPYSGVRCEVYDPCIELPCVNGGTCVSTNTTLGYTCQCTEFYFGHNCEVPDICSLSPPCQNGGTCTLRIEDNVALEPSYICTCPADFTGLDCEVEITPCFFSPCQNGGTCILDPLTVSGYSCQCRLAFLGQNCTQAITVPAFSGQSYLSFPFLPAPTNDFTLTLSLRTRTLDGLVLYAMGEANSFLSLGLQNGILEFMFNFGSAPVEIRGNFFPIADGSWHYVEIGYDGQVGYLAIDSGISFAVMSENDTELVSFSSLYVGGVSNFSSINPLVMQTVGLAGCITDLTLNAQPVDLLGDALSGNGITQCAMGLCSPATCENEGICVDDSTTVLGYYCQCQLGFAGDNCEQDINIQVPSFSGQSYLAHALPTNVHNAFEIDLTILTVEPDGLLLFAAHSLPEYTDSILLTLEGGVAIFRYNVGSGSAGISSNVTINDGEWHVVTVGARQQMAYIVIDGVENTTGVTMGHQNELNLQSPLFVGGVTDYSFIPPVTSVMTGFIGCIRDLQIDGEPVDAVTDALVGLNIDRCTEPVCTYIVCQNGGTCAEADIDAGFMCECLDGFVGQFCESPIPLCDPNPCLFGGLCSQFGNTFSCLCPLERGGRLCQQEIAVTIPSFSGSSYIAYPPLTDASSSLTITITFNPTTPTGVMLFTSFSDTEFGDYVFVSLIESYVHFGFNLGDGDALLISGEPLVLNVWHTITVARSGLNGTLIVDGMAPVYGSSAPPFTGLNVHSNLYLGGHISFINIFSIAGTSLGFIGCVSSVIIDESPVDLILDAEFGYGVGMCNLSSCTGNPCMNGGICTETGSSFVCECVAGYIGPLCGSLMDPCTSGEELCAAGSTCQPGIDGVSYTCLCPLGRGGETCDEVIEVITPAFNQTSHLRYPPLESRPGASIKIALYFNPSNPHGLLYYSGNISNNRDFISISLIDQRVEFRYDLGSGPAIIISEPIALNIWHNLVAYRLNQMGSLDVNGNITEGESSGTSSVLDLAAEDYYLGGVDDYSIVSPRAGTEVGFTGCIESLRINDENIDLIGSSISGFDITQCEADPCITQPCANGGTCQFQGSNFTCLCVLGFTGPTCLTAAELVVPEFTGQSYIAYPSLTNAFAVTSLYLEILPRAHTGLILHNDQLDGGDDYITITLQSGQVEFRYSLGPGSSLVLRSNATLALEQWHTIEVYRSGSSGQLIVDNSLPISGSAGGIYNSLQLGNDLFLGGVPDLGSVPVLNDVGIGFTGCIRTLRTGAILEPVDLIADAEYGAGITNCDIPACNIFSCFNGGTCLETSPDTFVCSCPVEFTGVQCKTPLCEISNPCQNNGICSVMSVNGDGQQQCQCSLPYEGQFCTERASFSMANFTSEGYLQYGVENNQLSITTAVEFTITPSSLDGLIFFIGPEFGSGDYLSVGLNSGFVEYRYDLGSGPAFLNSSEVLQIGNTYTIFVDRSDTQGTLYISGQNMVSGESPTGSYHLNLNVNRAVIYIGGAPSVASLTEDSFDTGFNGCISDVSLGPLYNIASFPLDSAVIGLSVTYCTAQT